MESSILLLSLTEIPWRQNYSMFSAVKFEILPPGMLLGILCPPVQLKKSPSGTETLSGCWVETLPCGCLLNNSSAGPFFLILTYLFFV